MKIKSNYLLYVALCSIMGMVFSCAEDEMTSKDNGRRSMSFTVSDVQAMEEDASKSRTMLPSGDEIRSIDFAEDAGSACLQETTVNGVNPVKIDTQTRATLQSSINSDFGVFACKNGGSNPDFFYNEKVSNTGTMENEFNWSPSVAASLKFYAVSPYLNESSTNQKLVQATPGSMPYVDFTTSPDVTNQTDLMRAVTENIPYTPVGGTSHVIPLKFHHALTAIRFGVGSNLSWAKTIKSVEFIDVFSKGHYNIITGEWDAQSTKQNFKLDGLSVSTSAAQNNVILKDGNTFLMVPQTLPAGAKVVVTFTDGSRITAKIEGGKWKPGTTKTYMMTEKNSNWQYIIQASDPTAAAYNDTQTGNYEITSYRQVGVERQAVKWKVVGYDADNDGTYSMDEKPDWVDDLSLKNGDGGTSADRGFANVKQGVVINLLDERNANLKLDPKGNPGNYYDLSKHDLKGNATPRHTANCYLISHPGYYKIPLVYGNAIKGTAGDQNRTNESSYKSSITNSFVLRIFKDHNDQDITDPWIERTNSNANNGINGARVEWSDAGNLVRIPINPIVRESGETFLQFEVKANDINTGNAVVSVMKDNVVVWSWHLWFTSVDALETTHLDLTEAASENLGWKYTAWRGTAYRQPRKVKVRVEQLLGPKRQAEFTITQNPGVTERQGYGPFYQFGRKDPFRGTGNITINTKTGGRSLGYAIQYPRSLFGPKDIYGSLGERQFDWCNKNYFNLWSMNKYNAEEEYEGSIKTIYDPCPAGFQVPSWYAFTNFTKQGKGTVSSSEFCVSGPWDSGWNFNNQRAYSTATLYFPAAGVRSIYYPNVMEGQTGGYYWSAHPAGFQDDYYNTNGYAYGLSFSASKVHPIDRIYRATGLSVRPFIESAQSNGQHYDTGAGGSLGN